MAREEALHCNIDNKRGKATKPPTLFTTGRHAELCERHPNDPEKLADALYRIGNNLVRDLRQKARADDKNKAEAATTRT